MGVAVIGGATSGGGTQPYEQYFRSSGTWTNPGVTRVEATCIGGSGGTNANLAASGAGGYIKANLDVTGVSSVPVVVGAAGTSTGAGGTSSFGDYLRAFGSLAVTSANAGGAAGGRLIPGVINGPGGTFWENYTQGSVNPNFRVAYGNGLFVAVGHLGTSSDTRITTSPDGQTWTERDTGISAPWADIIYAGGQFVAIAGGNNGSNVAATSPDGITWTQRTLSAAVYWGSIAYGNGTYVVVPSGANFNSVASTSPDGITWTTRNLPDSVQWSGVAYGAGLFVAIRKGSINYATSPDGITWTARSNLPSGLSWGNIAYGGGLFVATAGGTPYTSDVASNLATSPDGTTWTSRNLPYSLTWNRPIYGGGVWLVTTGSSTTNGQYLARSTNGTTWSTVDAPPSGSYPWCGAAYGAGTFVLIGGAPDMSYGGVARGWDATYEPMPGFAGANGDASSSYSGGGGGAAGPATKYLAAVSTNYTGARPGPGIDGYCVGGTAFDPAPMMPGCGVSGTGRAGNAGIVIVRWWK